MATPAEKTLNIGVVGYGYWGPHIARNLSEMPQVNLLGICDLSSQRQRDAGERFKDVGIYASLHQMLAEESLDAVVIATPPNIHYSQVVVCLNAGLHVLVEKPLTDSLDKALELEGLARSKQRVLMVDHTYLFADAVSFMYDSVRSGELGKLIYFDSSRVNLGLFQSDVSVIWDLAVHDLAILKYVIGISPVEVSATAGFHRSAQHPAVAALTMFYEENFFAHVNVSWLSPVKLRQTILSGSDKTIVFDDLKTDEKIKIYDAGVDQIHESENKAALLQYRLGTVTSPRLPIGEALRKELEHFCSCIIDSRTPMSSAEFSIDIIACLEAAQTSIENHGKPQMIKRRK